MSPNKSIVSIILEGVYRTDIDLCTTEAFNAHNSFSYLVLMHFILEEKIKNMKQVPCHRDGIFMWSRTLERMA